MLLAVMTASAATLACAGPIAVTVTGTGCMPTTLTPRR